MTTAAPEVDYALAFEELTILNRLLSKTFYGYTTKPNPKEFETIIEPSDHGQNITVFKGLRSGMHFMALTDTTGNGGLRIGNFAPAKEYTREITDWVWL